MRETRFLGWDGPLLPAAVAVLRERFTSNGRWDLSGVTCVLPATHGVRRLKELLGDAAREAEVQLTPPDVITVGQLPDRLYEAPCRIARDLEQTLGWARALRGADPQSLGTVLPQVPQREPMEPWLEVAATIRRMKTDLAANRLRFREVAQGCDSELDRRRWDCLANLHELYLAELAQARLSDPDEERRQAAESGHCRIAGSVVLIGTSDLSPMLTEMLQELDGHVIALVAAPKSESHRFDEFGVVRPDRWRDVVLPLQDRHLIAAADVSDQATAVTESLATFADHFSPDQITIGVTDESQVGPVEVELRGSGVSTYRHLGWTVAQTSVGRLLALLAGYLQRRTWDSLAALVRHADVRDRIDTELMAPIAERGEVVAGSRDWLTDLDGLLANHFPIRVDAALPPVAHRNYPLAVHVAAWVDHWLGPLATQTEQPIAAWSADLDRWLNQTYPNSIASTESAASPAPTESTATSSGVFAPLSRTVEAVSVVHRLLRRWSTLNDQLDVPTRGPSAVELITGRLAEIRILEGASPGQVKILGWLDLALDDTAAVVVNGLNHPFVPEAVVGNAFLPSVVRTRLMVAENDRRYARDLYAMWLMLSTREEIRFIVGRSAADGSPTPPSRLLAAAAPEDVARRIRRLLAQPRPETTVTHHWDAGPKVTDITIPSIEHPVMPPALSVTAFRDYLICPYRFYLRHVLKIRPLDDLASELAANQFGDLVHAAVERFGESDDRDETSAAKIEQRLVEHLHHYAREHYGEETSVAVRLQVAQAEKRLQLVAIEQARRIAAGWTIHAAEAQVDEKRVDDQGQPKTPAGIVVDGQFMGLRGRFDRIDHHPDTGRWAILDYKTHGHRPEKKHLQTTPDGQQWIDLQLPLYRMMIPFLGIDADPAEVELGYFNVSEKASETRINIAEFTAEQIEDANDRIRDCIRGICAGQFAPTQERVPFDDYAMILQTGVSQRLLDAQEGEMAMEEPT